MTNIFTASPDIWFGGEHSWKVQMARGGWIAYLNFLQTQLDKLINKTNGEAKLALA